MGSNIGIVARYLRFDLTGRACYPYSPRSAATAVECKALAIGRPGRIEAIVEQFARLAAKSRHTPDVTANRIAIEIATIERSRVAA